MTDRPVAHELTDIELDKLAFGHFKHISTSSSRRVAYFDLIYKGRPVLLGLTNVELSVDLYAYRTQEDRYQFFGLVDYDMGFMSGLDSCLIRLGVESETIRSQLKVGPSKYEDVVEGMYVPVCLPNRRSGAKVKLAGDSAKCRFFLRATSKEEIVNGENTRKLLPKGSRVSVLLRPRGWASTHGFGVKFVPLIISLHPVKRCDGVIVMPPVRDASFFQLRSRLAQHLARINEERLGGLDISGLTTVLGRTGGCLTGSTVLQLLLGEYYPGSDLDVFISDEVDPTNLCYRLWGEEPERPTLSQYLGRKSKNADIGLNPIANVISYSNGVQFIQICLDSVREEGESDREAIVRYIGSFFDLDICTGIVTEERFLPPVCGVERVISKGVSVLGKLGFNTSKKIRDRLDKYQKRGFSLVENRYDFLDPDAQFFVSKCGHLFRLDGSNKSRKFTLEECPDCHRSSNWGLVEISEEMMDEYQDLIAHLVDEQQSQIAALGWERLWEQQHRLYLGRCLSEHLFGVRTEWESLYFAIQRSTVEDYERGVLVEIDRIQQEYQQMQRDLESRYQENLRSLGDRFVCAVCTDPSKEIKRCAACRKTICTECHSRLEACPFCRTIYVCRV
jgi:hypothetical protein